MHILFAKNIHTSHINIFIVNKYIFIANEYFIVNKYISIGNKYSCSKEIYFYIANKCFIVNKYIFIGNKYLNTEYIFLIWNKYIIRYNIATYHAIAELI